MRVTPPLLICKVHCDKSGEDTASRPPDNIQGPCPLPFSWGTIKLWARSLRLTLGMQLGSSAFGCQHGCQTPCVHNTDTRPRLLRAPEPSTGGHVRTHPTPACNPPSTCPFAFLQMCSSSARELPVVQMFKLGTGGRRKRVIKTTLSKERPFTFPSKHVTPT